jgi:hypothetical protein
MMVESGGGASSTWQRRRVRESSKVRGGDVGVAEGPRGSI